MTLGGLLGNTEEAYDILLGEGQELDEDCTLIAQPEVEPRVTTPGLLPKKLSRLVLIDLFLFLIEVVDVDFFEPGDSKGDREDISSCFSLLMS